MKTICLLAIALTAVAQSPVKVTKQSTPEKALLFEVSIAAPIPDVWHALTSSDGLSTWLTPGAVADLRNGGEWTAHFPGGKTGGGTILSFVPQKELVISAMAPEQFPAVRAQRTNVRFTLEGDGAATTVRLIQTGWKTGAEWDSAYTYLATGNAQMLDMLRRRFISGPIDWQKEWGLTSTAPVRPAGSQP